MNENEIIITDKNNPKIQLRCNQLGYYYSDDGGETWKNCLSISNKNLHEKCPHCNGTGYITK